MQTTRADALHTGASAGPMTADEWLDHYIQQAPILPDDVLDRVLELYELERA